VTDRDGERVEFREKVADSENRNDQLRNLILGEGETRAQSAEPDKQMALERLGVGGGDQLDQIHGIGRNDGRQPNDAELETKRHEQQHAINAVMQGVALSLDGAVGDALLPAALPADRHAIETDEKATLRVGPVVGPNAGVAESRDRKRVPSADRVGDPSVRSRARVGSSATEKAPRHLGRRVAEPTEVGDSESEVRPSVLQVGEGAKQRAIGANLTLGQQHRLGAFGCPNGRGGDGLRRHARALRHR
jgi:hypothetical protein